MPRPLDIDFNRTRARGPALGWALLVAGAFACAAAVHAFDRVEREVGALEAQARAHARPRTEARAPRETARDTKALAQGIGAASRVIDRLAEPWRELLSGIESASHEGVALLALEPDGARRSVKIAGEARDVRALTEYAQSLAARGGLTDLHLTQHEVRDERGATVLRFALSASWRDTP